MTTGAAVAPILPIELRYPTGIELQFARARKMRLLVWLPFFALGCVSVKMALAQNKLIMIPFSALFWLVPLLMELLMRNIENVTLRLKDTKIVIDAIELKYLGPNGDVLFAVSLDHAKSLWPRSSYQAAGHSICRVYSSMLSSTLLFEFTSYLDRGSWLAEEVLGMGKWPSSPGGG